MRIIALADTHGFHTDWPTVPVGDLLIHAGDLCRGGRLDELQNAASWLHSLPHRHKIVVAGNHDGCFQRDPEASRALLGPGIVYLEDSGTTVDGLRIWGSPWQPAFNDWAFNLPRGAPLAEKWSLIPEGIDLLITHGPPAGIGDSSGSDERAGCADLLAAVLRIRPALHVFGHIHQDGGFWSHEGIGFANVTTWECLRRPSVFDLDVESREVLPVEVPPAAT
jgi:predicted phosphodiesterase